MSSIADALKRAQQERERLRPQAEEPGGAPVGEPHAVEGPGLAAVVRRRAGEGATEQGVAVPPVRAPETLEANRKAENPLTAAVAQAPAQTPPALRKQQHAAETIVEDYTSKQKLNLPQALVVYHQRSGPIAEQYRKIRDSLMAEGSKGSQALVITSALPGEGKTTTLLNLGLCLNEIRSLRVLLVDGCLQGAPGCSLSRLLHMDHESGLAELLGTPLTTQDAIEPAIKASPWNNLFVLPAGARSSAQAAAMLLQSQNLRTLLRRLRGNFDWILIDSPAAGRLPDAGLLATASDGILLAAALHRTPQDQIQTTIRRLKSMNLPVKSCVLTRA